MRRDQHASRPGVVEPPIPIAVVLTSFDRGGTERQMTELVRRLDPGRFTVHVVCFRREGPWLPRVEEHAATITEVRLESFRSPATFRRLTAFAAWLRDRRIAVVQACDLYANVFALPAAALARTPVRIGSRRGIVSPDRTRGLLALQRLSYAGAHRVVANSGAAADRLRAEGVPQRKIAVIPNGIDLSRFTPAPRRHTRRVVTTLANLRPGKGHDVLLRAAVEVIRRRPDVTFLLVGDGPLRGTLEREARELGIAGRVTFLGHSDDVGAVLRASDLFAFPSFMEAFPNSVMEAMGAGLPVVATRVGGIPELVDHERNGILVPPGDAPAMASAILRMLEQPERANALGDAALCTIHARYSFEQMVQSFERLYLDELAGRGHSLALAASTAQ